MNDALLNTSVDILDDTLPPVSRQPTGEKKSSQKKAIQMIDPSVALNRGLVLFEELQSIQRKSEENDALKQVVQELTTLYHTQVGDRAAIVATLQSELERADSELERGHTNYQTAREGIDAARLAHAHELSRLQEEHRGLVSALRTHHHKQESLWIANADLRTERTQLREAVALVEREAVAARRHHQLALSEVEHACLLERATARRNLQQKLRTARQVTAASAGAGLGERAVQVVEEAREAARKLATQGEHARRALRAAVDAKEVLQGARRELVLLVDALGLAGRKEDTLQRRAQRLSARLQKLHGFLQLRDVAGYRDFQQEQQADPKSRPAPLNAALTRKQASSGDAAAPAPTPRARNWYTDTVYVRERAKRVDPRPAVTRDTLYAQQYRGGAEFNKPIFSRTVVPDALREQRARLAHWHSERGAPRPVESAGQSKEAAALEVEVWDAVAELRQLHRACEQECERTRSINARSHVIASLREESVALAQRALQDAQLRALRNEWRQQQQERAEDHAADVRDDDMTRLMMHGEIVPAPLQHAADSTRQPDGPVSEGVPWSLSEGIPPVLSKVRPADAVLVLRELLQQLHSERE